MRQRQSGFSLLELMFATTASMIIMVPATLLILQASGWSQDIQSKIAINRHARIIFEVFLNGGRATTNGNDGTKNVYGFNGLNSAPSSTFRTNYAFSYKSNNKTLVPDTLPSLSVACTAIAVPLPDCGSSGSKTVAGWVGSDAAIESSKRVVAGRTFEIQVQVTDPYQVQRMKNPARGTISYRTIGTLMRDESDP